MKFQGPTSKVSHEKEDDDWLQDEIAAIDPQIIFALGIPARKALQRIGFEQTDYTGPFHRDEGKVYEYSGSDARLQGVSAVQVFHLGSREPHNELSKIINGAISSAREVSQ